MSTSSHGVEPEREAGPRTGNIATRVDIHI